MKVEVLKPFNFKSKYPNPGEFVEMTPAEYQKFSGYGVVKQLKVKRTTKELKTKRETK
jgi:hypothetical protein